MWNVWIHWCDTLLYQLVGLASVLNTYDDTQNIVQSLVTSLLVHLHLHRFYGKVKTNGSKNSMFDSLTRIIDMSKLRKFFEPKSGKRCCLKYAKLFRISLEVCVVLWRIEFTSLYQYVYGKERPQKSLMMDAKVV